MIIHTTEMPLRTNFTLNRQQMNIQGGSILEAQGALGTSHVGGLARSAISANMQMEFITTNAVMNGQALACAAVRQININVKYEPNIFISREFKPGTCYHQAVMQHEMKHVITDRDIIKHYIPRMQLTFTNSVKSIGPRGPVAASQLPHLLEQIRGLLGTSMDKVMNALKAEREWRQSQIDTPSEYTRVQSLCKNWP